MNSITLEIDWAQLDLYGHVNNVAYYQYMQSGRIAFCQKLGLSVLNEVGKTSFILAASECHYKKKLHFPGSVQVISRVTEIHRTSFHLEHSIINQSGETAATGRDVLVIYDYESDAKTPISDDLRKKLEAHLAQ